MIGLAIRGLRARWVSLIAVLLSVLVGAALVTASVLVTGAEQDPVAVTGWRFGAVDAVVAPPSQVTPAAGAPVNLPSLPRLTDDQVAAISKAPGVTGVSLERPFPAYLIAHDSIVGDATTRSWGHPWSTALADGARLTVGAQPQGEDQIVVDEPVAAAAALTVGDRVRVQLSSGVRSYTLVGVVTRPGMQFEHALFFSSSTAAQLGEPVLALVTTRDVAGLAAAVPGLRVATGTARAHSLQLDLRQAELARSSGQFLMVIAALALLIAALVISSTLTVSIGQRRHELALLRLTGCQPDMVRRLIWWEAALLGLLGGGPGAAIGIGLARVARDFFVAQNLMARATPIPTNPGAVLLGAGSAVVTALLAALLPARRATRITPLEALRESQLTPARIGSRRTAAALLLGAAAAGCLGGVFALGGPLTTSRGTVAILLLAASFPLLLAATGMLLASLLGTTITLLRRGLDRCFGGFIAVRSIGADLRRAAGVAVPLSLLVAVGCVLLFQDAANAQARSQQYAEQLNVDLVVTGQAQLGVPLGAAQVVAAGVSASSPSVSTQLVLSRSGSTVSASGVDPYGFHQVRRLPVSAGSWENFGESSLAVSTVLAAREAIRVGDRIDFWYPDGRPGSAVVSTIYDDSTGAQDLVLPIAGLRAHLLEPFASAIYIRLGPGVDRQAARNAIQEALRDTAPQAVVADREQHLAQISEQSSGDDWIILLVVVVLGGYAGVSAINALVGSTMARRRELALLRLAGARRGQVVAAVVVESMIVAVTAVVAGTVVAALTMVGYGHLLTGTVWLPFVAPAYAGVVGSALLAAAIGSLAPARVAVRADPLEAMR